MRPIAPLPGAVATIIALCAAAPLAIPAGDVPITMQSLIVCLAGALTGGAGVAGVLVWLALAALGLPVLAGMKGGLLAMGGYSAGFIIGLPIAARVTTRWQTGWRWQRTLWLMLAGHGLLLALGAAGLGLRGGDVAGLVVLVPGAVVKAVAATVVLVMAGRRKA